MRVAIAGAGNVGRSIASELIENGHQILLIDRDPHAIKSDTVPEADWLLADACELSSLEEANIDSCDVVIAATGDDKANLVTSLLAKTEFGVPRTVARVNHPKNEWLFNDVWGVDVAVSTPRLMCALVEEAVTVGDLVRLLTFHEGDANLVEMTLPDDSPQVGVRIGDIRFPGDVVPVAIIRDGHAQAPDPDGTLEAGDELLFVTAQSYEKELAEMLAPRRGNVAVSVTATTTRFNR
jgi:trk system potassium uptake protein TrkA